ncbi:hypothetical protein GCM10020331_087780 [Ectobacillus funiculus]
MLEGLAASQLAQRGDVPELHELIRAMEHMEKSVKEGNLDGYVEANDGFS